ncbi:MAG TPA: tRNA-dihydrouridine synthase family protein [Thermoanaerobaculia bacterium]|nr:tRNA-dihydrouridine synthase family protein [Thermoanaerobaculia bacterium]
MLRLGSLTVDPPLALAPMAGITDRDFRLLVRRIGGAGVVSMEFLSARGLADGEERWTRLTHFAEEERPLAIQIYGADAAAMEEAARVVEGLRPDVCDINMGCPANKVLKGCAGAALMGDLPLAREMIRRVRRQLSMPLTVKFRLGLDERRQGYLELGRLCQDEGVDGVTLHPRTARQMFRGAARWEAVARLKEALTIPVLGNGDVRAPEDAVRRLRETGCDGVMIGRGATRNPWIFRQVAARLSGGAVGEPTLADRRDLVLGHFRAVLDREPAGQALHKLRTFTGVYSHGLPQGHLLRRQIQGLPDAAGLYGAVARFFEQAEAAAAVRAA